MNPADSDEQLAAAIAKSLVEGRLPCAAGLQLAERFAVEPGRVGDTVERLGLKISNCQLGCFKFEKATHEDLVGRAFRREVISAIENSLVDGGLPCLYAHRLSGEIDAGLREIGDAASSIKIKVSHCQLNCFV